MEAVRQAWASSRWGGVNVRVAFGGAGYAVDDESRGTTTAGLASNYCDGRTNRGFSISRRCRRNVPQVCAPRLLLFCVLFSLFPCFFSRRGPKPLLGRRRQVFLGIAHPVVVVFSVLTLGTAKMDYSFSTHIPDVHKVTTFPPPFL